MLEQCCICTIDDTVPIVSLSGTDRHQKSRARTIFKVFYVDDAVPIMELSGKVSASTKSHYFLGSCVDDAAPIESSTGTVSPQKLEQS